MARNEEKQLARLNRFYLQKDKEEYLKKNPPRPKLGTLNTAADIQKWLPSIKKEIEFCVKQSMVTCYPEGTVQEFLSRVDKLKGEYRAFIRRLREVNPNLQATPWTDRPYAGQKRGAVRLSDESSDGVAADAGTASKRSAFQPLTTPILDSDDSFRQEYGHVESPQIIYSVNTDLHDQPLVFCKAGQRYGGNENGLVQCPHGGEGDVRTCETADATSQGQLGLEDSWQCNQARHDGEETKCSVHNSVVATCNNVQAANVTPGSIPSLNLPYSDSEDSSD
ncbi:uncharacterized protein LOC124117954 isoform X1 [Haliotis rufescens]|uniref:uncharacterized protein LOC124117954 isoform X1 n=1 Tax=Haliotis rufescens TaxID=6454 RepID=UPI00201F8178|nr:uncharacterized protein LOC124117954 isoform X1 [Haliotis rufescens]